MKVKLAMFLSLLLASPAPAAALVSGEGVPLPALVLLGLGGIGALLLGFEERRREEGRVAARRGRGRHYIQP